MIRTKYQGLFVAFAITLCFGLGTAAAERGETGSWSGQPGVAMQPQSDAASRAGSGVERRTREQMSLRTYEAAHTRAFKLSAAGGIDLSTGVVVFGGVGTHLGLYRAGGFLDPSFSIFGSIRAANGDALNFIAAFSIGPLGEIDATFFFAGGTGRFVDAVGQASGPVTFNPDFTFVIDVDGHLNY